MTTTTTITVRQAYDKGRRSARSVTVDPDEAIARFSRKYCRHHRDALCELEHAWWNGFQDEPYGKPHAPHCKLGIAHPSGHAECKR